MKKAFIFILLLFSCKESVVPKPERLIAEETMEAIIYDLVLLEAIKNNQPMVLENKGVNPYNYIYTKYQIDSLQWVHNNKYYASDVKNYKHMFDRVRKKIEAEKAYNDTLLAKKRNHKIEKVKSETDTTQKRKKFIQTK